MEWVLSVVVPFERVPRPGGSFFDETAHKWVGQHLSASGLHLGGFLRATEEIQQGAITRPWFVGFEQPVCNF
jgi:hypothetical protein